MTKLKESVEKAFELAELQITETGEAPPFLQVSFIDEEGETKKICMILVTDENSKKGQNMFIQGLGLLFGALKHMNRIKDMESLVFSAESWFSSEVIKTEDFEKGNYKMPSQETNRREMLMTAGLTEDGTTEFKCKEIFSQEIKGKRYFSLSEIKDDLGDMKMNILEQFFTAYQKAKVDVTKENEEYIKKTDSFRNMSVKDLLETGIKSLMKDVGGHAEVIKK